MKNIAIIADDLTGASDSGVQFCRQGLRTIVVLEAETVPEDAGAEVIVVDTDSRALSAGKAYERVKTASQLLKEAGIRHIYKKLDSTLRGNIGAEIDAVMDAYGYEAAVVAPAFPKIGRTTVDGVHYLHGVPLHETEIARDPKCPVRESDLVKLLSTQSKRKVGSVKLEMIRAGIGAVREEVRRLVSSGVQLLVFDAAEEKDLQRIAFAAADTGLSVLYAGSAGLAEYVPQALSLNAREEADAAKEAGKPPEAGRPVLLVAGSVSSVTSEQLARLLHEQSVAGVELDPAAAAGNPADRDAEIARCSAEIRQALAAGRDAVFYVQRGVPAALGVNAGEAAFRIADALGKTGAQIVREHQLAGLILTGGDTAKAVCRALNVTALRLEAELEPGVPISRLQGGGDLLVVTKAGAFGSRETLVRALHALKGK